MKITKTPKQKTIHRIKIIEGHIKAVELMLMEDAYCVDIIHQSRAVQTVLKKLDMAILEDHLKSCVVEQIKDNKEQKAIDELLTLYKMI